MTASGDLHAVRDTLGIIKSDMDEKRKVADSSDKGILTILMPMSFEHVGVNTLL
jgi:hypothetical protein